MAIPLYMFCWLLVLGLHSGDYLQIVKCVSFDYTVVSTKVWIQLTGLTTPFTWLSLPQLTVLSRSAIVV